MDRRRVLKLFKTAAITATAWPLLRGRTARAAPGTRPRFYLQIVPQGGMDAIYTTDPKKVGEVDKGVDVPFAASAIVETKSGRLGPSFASLAKWMPRMAIVNGLRQNSANHVSGLSHILRCKTHTADTTPTLLEILGTRREREATGALSIGAGFSSAFSPKYFGSPSKAVYSTRPGLFEYLDDADPDDLRAVAKALRREAEPLQGRGATAAEQTSAANMVEAADLFGRVSSSPKFSPSNWAHPLESYYQCGRDLQRAMWLFEHQLTRCVTVCICGQDFDTHVWNTTLQPSLTQYLASLLDSLFTELDARIVDGRPLSQQTVVIVGSEIGRFPRLNASHGKDHFPQVPVLFFGPGIATGRISGATGREMASLPVSLESGKPDRGGQLLHLDDIGTTMLALDGANPEVYGYAGSHLDFLRDSG